MTRDCLTCGACCVGQDILIVAGDLVPPHMYDGYLLRQLPDGRCAALVGHIGRRVSCSIYDRRPQICRSLDPGSAWCEKIRECCAFLRIGR